MGMDEAFGIFVTDFLPMILILIVMVSSMVLIINRNFIKLFTFLGMAGILIAALYFFGIFSFSETESGEFDSESDDDATSDNIEAEEEEVDESAPAEPIDWSPVVFGLGALLTTGALAAGGGLTYKGVKAGKAARRQKEELRKKKEENIRRWDTVRESHQSILSRYAEYETDVWKALKYPALHDVSVEETSAFLGQMRVVNSVLKEQENTSAGTIGGTDDLYHKLVAEVDVLIQRFELAEKRALKMQWKSLPEEERKDLKSAIQLLKHAENEGNSPAARQTYYEQLQKVIDRLNSRHAHDIIPATTVKTLTSGNAETLMLTDGSENNEGLDINDFLKNQESIDDEEEAVPAGSPFKNRFQKIRDRSRR